MRDQLVGILLMRWWWGNQESASSTLWFQNHLGPTGLVGGEVGEVQVCLVGDSVSARQLEGPGSEYCLPPLSRK